MDKVWQAILGGLLGAVVGTYFIWKEQEPDKRLSQAFGLWWFALSACSVVLIFAGKPGSIYFLTAGSASLIMAVCLHSERNFNMLFGAIAFLPAMSGLAIYLKGNQVLGTVIIMPFVVLQGIGAYMDWRKKTGKAPGKKPPTRSGRGPQRGGRR